MNVLDTQFDKFTKSLYKVVDTLSVENILSENC